MLVLLAAGSPALPCSCSERNFCAILARGVEPFISEVVSGNFDSWRPDPHAPGKVRFKVIEDFGTEVPKRTFITTETDPPGFQCSPIHYVRRRRYLVIPARFAGLKNRDEACSSSRAVETVADEIRYL